MRSPVPVLLLRHGSTTWNEIGRLQGRTDVGLSDAGRSALEQLRPPAWFHAFRWSVTPLRRTAETATALGLPVHRIEPLLVELDCGRWEGSTREELRERYGEAYEEMGRRGLDFRPDGGESSRELRARLGRWLSAAGAEGHPLGAVTHKGIIQMALAMATGWDLVSKRPHRLQWDHAHLFVFDPTSLTLAIERLNIAIDPGSPAPAAAPMAPRP